MARETMTKPKTQKGKKEETAEPVTNDNKTKDNKLEKMKYNRMCDFLTRIEDKKRRKDEMVKLNVRPEELVKYISFKLSKIDKSIENMESKKDMLKKMINETNV